MFNNCNKEMLSLAGSSVNKYGKDQTGKITYNFDSYGFREGNEYNIKPSIIFFGCSYLAGIGVGVNQRFSNYFDNSWNFGLCGKYTEEESLINYDSFKKSCEEYTQCKIVFCWRSTNTSTLKKLIMSIDNNKNIYHTIPSNLKLENYRLMRNLENIDHDISGTHYGPRTHLKFSKLLWHFLK